MTDPVDFESATVVCSGAHGASVELRQTYDRDPGLLVASVAGSTAEAAQALGWQFVGSEWLCPLCLADRPES